MKTASLAVMVTMVFCVTLLINAQVPQHPTSSQAVISLDFAQRCVGDSWKLKLSYGPASTPIRLIGTSNGSAWEILDWHRTGEDGSYTEEGTFGPGTAGSHTLKMVIGGVLSNTLSFVVSECILKGSRIAFASTRDGGGSPSGVNVPYIYVTNADGWGITRLTQGASPAWSPDGQRIAFHTWSRGFGEIRVIDADGSNERAVSRAWYPSWSPDGKKIVVQSGSVNSEGGIFIMNADGSGATRIVSNEFANPGIGDYAVERPTWSPDGQSIAFVRTNYQDPWSLHILDLATGTISSSIGGERALGDSRTSWSPDGTRLLFQPFESIASVNRDGSGLQTHLLERYSANPDWSPDGKSIVYQSRMRIFIRSLEDGSSRQLIPEAVNPVLRDYRDSEPAWSRVRP